MVTHINFSHEVRKGIRKRKKRGGEEKYLAQTHYNILEAAMSEYPNWVVVRPSAVTKLLYLDLVHAEHVSNQFDRVKIKRFKEVSRLLEQKKN